MQSIGNIRNFQTHVVQQVIEEFRQSIWCIELYSVVVSYRQTFISRIYLSGNVLLELRTYIYALRYFAVTLAHILSVVRVGIVLAFTCF